MTDKNILQAKKRYQELIKEKEILKKKKEKFLDFSLNDRHVQEFLVLENWGYFNKRYSELMQKNTVRQYLYLMSKYNNFEEITDNELVERAFRNIIKEKDSSNIYVYLGSYTFDDNYEKIEVKSEKEAIAHEYINLETENKKMIPIDEIYNFKKDNTIITFKNKHHKPIDLFYRYRIMYLRQFLLDNNINLFNETGITNKIKTKTNIKRN